MRQVSTAALLTLVVAASAVAGTAAGATRTTSGYFETPSKDIICGYFFVGGTPALLECGVASGLIPPAPRPPRSFGSCQVDDPASDRVRLHGAGETFSFCAGDPGVIALQGRVPTLGYGASIHKGPFTCSSATSGLTCRNSAGHGFFLSRQSWRRF